MCIHTDSSRSRVWDSECHIWDEYGDYGDKNYGLTLTVCISSLCTVVVYYLDH